MTFGFDLEAFIVLLLIYGNVGPIGPHFSGLASWGGNSFITFMTVKETQLLQIV